MSSSAMCPQCGALIEYEGRNPLSERAVLLRELGHVRMTADTESRRADDLNRQVRKLREEIARLRGSGTVVTGRQPEPSTS